MDFEGRWIRKIQQSAHEESANKLIKKYYREMFAFVYRQFFDEQMAQDLTQEIFIRALQSISHFDGRKASFRTWLYRIASNHCIDYFRSRSYQAGQQTVYVEEIEMEGSDSVVEELSTKEDIQLVNELLQRFDVKDQQIVRFKLFLELTFHEIAGLLVLSESTVKKKILYHFKKA